MDVPLREYVDAMFTERDKAIQAALKAQKEAVDAALSAADKAVTKAERDGEKWRENANEWRGAMNDRDRELPSRREVESAIAAVETRLGLIEGYQQQSLGVASQREKMQPWMLWAAGVLLTVIVVASNFLTG